MTSSTKKWLLMFPALGLGLLLIGGTAAAQTSTPTPKAKTTDQVPTSATTGTDSGNYTITSSIEVGYRGIRVDGDEQKYRSDLNYKAGPRLFDASFLMKSKDGKGGGLFETLMVTGTGWGADPTGSMRISIENPKWYRFEGQYRRAKYYRFLNNVANPNWLFSGFPVPPNPATGLHGYNTRTEFGDFDLTILPKNEFVRLNFGYSPERYEGPYFSNYHIGGNEFQTLINSRTRANDIRFGADGKFGKVDWTLMQGFRGFRDDSTIDTNPAFINPDPTKARFTTFQHAEPTRGRIDYTRGSLHTFLGNRFDITGRIVYSKATSNSTFLESMTGPNFNTRISGQPAPPNTLLLGAYNIPSNARRPNTQGDIGITILVTDKFRVSNTFRVEDFTIDGVATFNDLFSVRTPAGVVDTRRFSFLQAFRTTKYRKYQDTVEGDYQFNKDYSVHFGYRYGNRHEQQFRSGFGLGSNAPVLEPTFVEELTNHTNAFFGGFRARFTKNWTVYFDAERGTADNVFTRIGNYDYTNIRAKSRWVPNRKINFNAALIIRDNSNPSEIAGVSLSDFGVNLKTRIFQSSLDWIVNPELSVSFGYNYNWVNSDAVIDYFYQVPPAASVEHPIGHALYFQRNNFFFTDVVWRPNPRFSFFGSYRINKDNGQGNRLPDPAGNPGTLINSYPMSFQSPEGRLAIRLNRHFDWNLGYQYYNYNEDGFLRTFPGSPRAQNYHAHLPYMSLRWYIGRKE